MADKYWIAAVLHCLMQSLSTAPQHPNRHPPLAGDSFGDGVDSGLTVRGDNHKNLENLPRKCT